MNGKSSLSPSSKKDMLGKGRFILLVRPGEEERVQYLIARKIFNLWKKESFSRILELCRRQKDILVKRSDDGEHAEKLAGEFMELGADAEVREQKKIAGHDLY